MQAFLRGQAVCLSRCTARADRLHRPLQDPARKVRGAQTGVEDLVELIEAQEPQLLSHGFHLDEDESRMTVVAVHPDAASVELHMEIGGETFRRHSVTPDEWSSTAGTPGSPGWTRGDALLTLVIRERMLQCRGVGGWLQGCSVDLAPDEGTQMATSTTTPITLDVASGLVNRAARAFNDHDAPAFTAVMAPDVEFIHSALPEPMRGRAEVATTYSEHFWRAFPDLNIALSDGPLLHPTAPRAAVDWQVRGTHLGPLDPPGLAPTGRTFTTVARELLTVENGLAGRIHLIMDMADIMRQLGVLPASGSRGEAAMMAIQRLQQRSRGVLRRRA